MLNDISDAKIVAFKFMVQTIMDKIGHGGHLGNTPLSHINTHTRTRVITHERQQRHTQCLRWQCHTVHFHLIRKGSSGIKYFKEYFGFVDFYNYNNNY